MEIGGLQKTSTIDYPGQLTAILFTQGCNLRCPYCHNPELIPFSQEEVEFDKQKFFDFLEKRKGILDAVTITGGEPTLQNDLIEFIKEIKSMGYLVKLDTNGLVTGKLSYLVKNKLVDYVAMDIKLPIENYNFLGLNNNGVKNATFNFFASIKILTSQKDVDFEFRTTVVPGIHSKKIFEKTVKQIKGAKNFYIQNFRPNKTLDKNLGNERKFTEKELKEFKEIAEKYVDNVHLRN